MATVKETIDKANIGDITKQNTLDATKKEVEKKITAAAGTLNGVTLTIDSSKVEDKAGKYTVKVTITDNKVTSVSVVTEVDVTIADQVN